MPRFVSSLAVAALLLPPSLALAQPVPGYDPVPGPSRFGPDDQAGASNTHGPEKVKEAQALVITDPLAGM